MQNLTLPLQLAPNNFSQAILPNWGFSLFSVNLGRSNNPELESQILNKVGSYGKQLGHLAEALEVVIHQLKLLDSKDLSQSQRDALQTFLGDVAQTRIIKHKAEA